MQSDLRRDTSSRTAVALGIFGVLSLPLLLAMLPVSTLLWFAGVGCTCLGIASIPWPKGDGTILPDDIADPVLRGSYVAILSARSELEQALVDAPGTATMAHSVNARCGDAVRMCARLAPIANRVHAYLSAHDTAGIAHDLDRLRASAEATRDEETRHVLAQAILATEHQLEACEQLIARRERIRAQLGNVLAALRAFTAAVVKQQTGEDEQLALAGEPIAEHLDEVWHELGVLESALQLAA